MSDDHNEEHGQQLRDELHGERQKAGGDHRWRCSSDARERVVAYAVACSTDGESHGRVTEQLGVGQGTLSRWIRRRRRAKGSVRPVAIVPATQDRTTRAVAMRRSAETLGEAFDGAGITRSVARAVRDANFSSGLPGTLAGGAQPPQAGAKAHQGQS